VHRLIATTTFGLTAAVVAACSGAVATTADSPAPSPTPAPGAPSSTERPSNANLADAFDFYGESNGRAGYFFTTPSGTWRCAIIPHDRAGCQSAKGAASLGVTGEPDTVTDAAGAEVVPNTLVVQDTGDAHFAKLGTDEFRLVPGTAQTLPFGKILAAAGFRCNVQNAGIACLSEDSNNGFTFSSDGYTLSYTDVPAVP
jgi:hypothetical protein